MNQTQMLDYRQILKEVLENRCRKNQRYSLRSFARDLDIAPSRLSDVMRGRYGISAHAAAMIGKKIGLADSELDRFISLVESQHARRKVQRDAAKKRVLEQTQFNQVSQDFFRSISDWYHYAILELTLVHKFKSDITWISQQLGISEQTAQTAIDRLLRLEMLEKTKDGILRIVKKSNSSISSVPSEAIRNFHRQILKKALDSVDLQTIEERDLSSMTLAIDSSELKEAKEMIMQFRRKFDRRFGASEPKDRVYNLSIQFFALTQKGSL